MFTLFKGMYPHIRVFKVLIYPCVLGVKGMYLNAAYPCVKSDNIYMCLRC